ncbi:hypothetical protein EFR84_12130 [Rhizobium chutanense]|uniref:Uncharacterized protein n=1 Tax=Rhizobium chutanense TaxID=2035448 RepID=A0A432P2S8_9HYPH|nr:hypothetical protein EFR84_12130 [Rhizobium chutanense]
MIPAEVTEEYIIKSRSPSMKKDKEMNHDNDNIVRNISRGATISKQLRHLWRRFVDNCIAALDEDRSPKPVRVIVKPMDRNRPIQR